MSDRPEFLYAAVYYEIGDPETRPLDCLVVRV